MKIKKDDNVKVLTGTDKGKTGKVLKAFPKEWKVIVEGINIQKRHQRARKSGQKGQIIETAFPIHVSNLAKLESNEKKPKAKTEKPKSKPKTKAEAKK